MRLPLLVSLLAGLAAAGPVRADPDDGALPASPAPVTSATGLAVYPDVLRLDDRADRVGLVIQATLADGTTRDVTAEAALSVADAAVAAVESGAVLAPVADGETTLVVSHAGQRREVPVVVRGAARPRRPSFGNDVLPVLTRAGCNAGACHGASRGKDGFALSLFGYDPAGDHHRITREEVGRRINLALPEESLLLQKATGAVRHTGGGLIEPGGHLHRTLVAWLQAGALPDPADLPALTGLELRPAQTVLLVPAEGAPPPSQRLSARALYGDGADRDVTGLTALGSSDASVARVDADGVVVAAGRPGEAWITARFGDKVVAAQVLVVPDDAGFTLDEADDHEVDRLVHEKLRRLRLPPAPPCDDATFLRRVTLDLAGRLPTPAEVEAFLADGDAGKRAALVDRLLADPAFVRLWTLLWAEKLLVRSDNRVSPKAALGYARWLQERIAAGVPLDALVRELLTASGGTLDTPPTNYFHAEEDTKQLAENTAQAFLGIRLQCAQCHNHPFDRWTQDDYYGFAAFFAQVGRKPGGDPRERLVFNRGGGELNHPVTGKPAAPRFLGGDAPDTRGKDRRQVLADWITAADNPWFARNAANMVWAHLFGQGLVDEPDDVRVSNPPSNPALLDALAGRLRASGYDVKDLVRHVVTSRAYQRATLGGHDDDPGAERNLARAHVRRLRAEVLLDAIAQATDVPHELRGLPKGAPAVQIPDGATTTEFLTTFGRSKRESVCACEVRTSPNLGQALHLLNGDTVNGKIRQGKVVPRLLTELKEPAQVVRALYLRTLSRPPTDAEVEAALALLPAGAPTPGLEDLFWALLNSREFLFNH
ncbi:MAG: DUF1549 and DUF1553 domain-containing protein [Planctomycetes bacterium]|nr:DUF1549 and DUF1553 domain-containing protein [Planctomycetota bacterium]